MLKKRIGIAMLLIFLLWRSANTVYVLAVDPRPISHWQDGLTNDTSERIARALDLTAGGDVHTKRYRLLRDKVPPHSDLFFLHEYSGTADVYEILAYFRLSALLYPRNTQMVKRPPAPQAVIDRSVDSKGRFVVDLRRRKSKLAEEFVNIGKSPNTVLWREGKPGR